MEEGRERPVSMGKPTASDERSERTPVLIGGAQDCPHDDRQYLGHMGPNPMHACETCGGVLVNAP